MCVCVCVCVRTRVRACVHMFYVLRVLMHVCMHVHMFYVLCDVLLGSVA